MTGAASPRDIVDFITLRVTALKIRAGPSVDVSWMFPERAGLWAKVALALKASPGSGAEMGVPSMRPSVH